MQKLLVVDEVLDLLQISRSSLDRLVRQARSGTSLFPSPVQQGAKKKLLWHMADIERWTNYYPATPVSNVAAVTSPVKQRQAAKTFQQRQEAAQQVLMRHGVVIIPKRDANALDELFWNNRKRFQGGQCTKAVTNIKGIINKHNMAQDAPTEIYFTKKFRQWIAKVPLPIVDRMEINLNIQSWDRSYMLEWTIFNNFLRESLLMKNYFQRLFDN